MDLLCQTHNLDDCDSIQACTIDLKNVVLWNLFLGSCLVLLDILQA